ncbi:MAG: MaoC family dehydratase [candidate division Zixibacteria bacterium]|nr:MaoC family dehydratase [candidate division Zixibacteria bacterium]MDD5425128.1 MaoC family dehydratase [candidate division Zixibacteria bacterium]
MSSYSYNELKVGDRAEVSKTISETDIYLFAGITGDMNPAHVNEEYAKGTAFGKRIAHGMLVCGLISNVLGNYLPGHGTIYMRQSVTFLAPVYMGDTITARVEVIEKRDEKKRVLLKTSCMNQKGEVVIDGEALVSPPRKQD